MRATVAVVLATLGALLAAFIMAEYEFEGLTPWASGLAVGVLVGELVSSLGRWRGVVPMVVTAVIAGGGILYGQRLETGGVEPFALVAWPAAALAAAVAAWNVRPSRSRPA